MNRSFIRSVVVIAIMQLLAVLSCFPGSDDCTGFKQTYFKAVNMRVVNIDKTETTYSSLKEVPDSTGIFLENFAIAIVLEVEYFTNLTRRFENPFVASALACSPPPPEPVQKITAIDVASDVDFVTGTGDTLAAGTSLNHLFRVSKSFKNDFSAVSIQEFLNGSNAFPSDDIASDYLHLQEAPANNFPRRFIISYVLDNGEVFTGETTVVRIF
jgi:hypothetical protein